MKGIIVVTSIALLFGCSSTSDFNSDLERRNLSLVKVTQNTASKNHSHYDVYIEPLYSDETHYIGTSLEQINGGYTTYLK